MIKKFAVILILTLSCGISFNIMGNGTTRQNVEIADNTPVVSGETGSITIANNGGNNVFSIYSITGQLVKSVRLSGEYTVSVDMPKGFYIVKCNAWSRKVVVK